MILPNKQRALQIFFVATREYSTERLYAEVECMNFVRQLIRHIGSCITAEKGKRIFYAVVNIAFIAIAVLSGWGVLKAWEIMFSETFIGGLLLLIVCATFAILFLIDGVIGQLIHTVVNLIFGSVTTNG